MSVFVDLLFLVPAVPLAAGLAARFLPASAAARLTAIAAWSAFALASVAAVAGVLAGPTTVRWAPGWADAAAVAIRLDAISGTMSVLVSFLGAVVVGFSRRYLDGDRGQASFVSWMSLTLASVLTLVLAGHLLLLLAAWIATSLCLHRLLLFYPERAGARFSARKKFVFSRLGDLCLLAAALILHRQHGTFDLDTILRAISAGTHHDLAPVASLLALGAMLKSAQFPFHSWLPDTMETPTPVSAFMHAGIINAGGFLIVRLSPVFTAVPSASALLAITGAVTAAFGAVVMLAQPSVKRALAYSTVAQMGFMFLQCGLGGYGLALLHIVAHSLYKAHAFLTAGSTIGAVPRTAVPLRTPAITLGVLAGAVLVMLGTVLFRLLVPAGFSSLGVFGLILALALAYGIARAWSAAPQARTLVRAGASAFVIALLSLALHRAASLLYPHSEPPWSSPAVPATVGSIFAGLFIFQSLLWRANRSPLGRRLYVHALNGFYVGTHLNRLLGRLWPTETVRA